MHLRIHVHTHTHAGSNGFSRSVDYFICPLLFVVMYGMYRRTYYIFIVRNFLLFWHWMSCLLEPLASPSFLFKEEKKIYLNLVHWEGGRGAIKLLPLQDLGDHLFSLFVFSEAVQFADLLPQIIYLQCKSPTMPPAGSKDKTSSSFSRSMFCQVLCFQPTWHVFRINILTFSYPFLNV